MSIEKFDGNTLNNRMKDGFTIVLSSVAQQTRDWAALGLYLYLASLPSTWIINVRHLETHCGKGKDYVYRLLNELIRLGLLERTEKREGGRFVKYEYNLYLSPLPGFPDTVLPEAVFPDAYKVNKIKNKDNRNINPISLKNSVENFEYPETLYPLTKVITEPTKTKALKTELAVVVEDNPHQIPNNLILEWSQIRKAKITPTVWKRLNNELDKCKCAPIEAFEEMISRGWSTLKAEWINRHSISTNNLAPNVSFFDHKSTSWISNIDKDMF